MNTNTKTTQPEPTVAALADWLSGEQYYLATALGLKRFEVMVARMILEAFDEHELALGDPFTWSIVFTPTELDQGVANLVPAWFVEGKSPLPTDWQTLSESFRNRLIRTYNELPAVGRLDVLAKQCDAAYLGRRAGLKPGNRIISEDGKHAATVTAIGRSKLLGVWIRRNGVNTSTKGRIEEELKLDQQNWLIHR